MLLELKPLFMGEADTLPIDCELDFSGLEWQGILPFTVPVRVRGKVTAAAGIVALRCTVSYRYDGRCDRCAEEFSRDGETRMEHILVTSLNHEENDDFVLLENYRLPLDQLVETDLLLSLPSKNLCREDCRGLCPLCGRNLNEGLCGCRRESTDPRFEALRQLLE